ncbi:MAG: leucine-rich repeat domain-containing protein, partial [Clostridia bacterium]|nr:leucine-rich repeat domain-containing protein [Clostridia bacterium]
MSKNRRNSKNTALSIIAVILALFLVASVVIGCGEYLGYFDNDDDEPDQTVTDPEGLEYTLSSDGTEYSVSGIGNYTAADLVIPAEYDGIAVTSIDDYAFYKCTTIESVYIPESVTSIGKCAFYRSGLQDITFEETRTWYCQTVDSSLEWRYLCVGVDVTHELTAHYITDMYAEYYWISYYDTYGSTLNGVSFSLYDTFY